MLQQRLIIVSVLLLCAGRPAYADKVFAHSKSLNMSFTAMGDPWCAADVRMQVAADDAGTFDTPDYNTLIQKLGYVLTQECPEASTLAITGVKDGATVWTGNATRASGWVAQKSTDQPSAVAAVKPSPPAAPVAAAAAAKEAVQAAPVAAAAQPDTAGTATGQIAGAQSTRVVKPLSEAIEAEQPAIAEPVKEIAAAPAVEQSPATAKPVDAGTTAADQAPATVPVMEIDGWKPGGPTTMSGSAADTMKDIVDQDTGCSIHTLTEVNDAFKPTFKMNQDYDCINGYAKSTNLRRQGMANLFYEGQQQPFVSLSGFWTDGYNLKSGFPKQIVSVYDSVQQQTRYAYQAPATVKMLVWAGEDTELHAHFFATYTYGYQQWQPDGITNFIVVTDNEELKNNPDKTGLAQSLAQVYMDFFGYKNTNQFNSVSFFITDKMLKTPAQTYQQALSEANPDASLYKAGRAIRQRGTPWMIQVQTDFIAKREAFKVAEQQRLEAEKQRMAQLRARHQAALDQQYQQLATAANYDKVRFYATLMLDGDRMKNNRIDFTSNRAYYGNALGGAVVLSHPARYLDRVDDGTANLGGPMYMLVEADDGEIEKPYPMTVTHSDASVELDDWMLVRTGPEFGFHFDDDGMPVFEITIEDAVACESDKCLDEMDAAHMMKAWYADDDMEFAAVSAQ
jgi:hypothetical protein